MSSNDDKKRLNKSNYDRNKSNTSEVALEANEDIEFTIEHDMLIRKNIANMKEIEEKYKNLASKVYTLISFGSVITLLGISNVVLFPRTFSGLDDLESIKTLLSSITLIIIYNLSIITVIYWALYWIKKHLLTNVRLGKHFISAWIITVITFILIIVTYIVGYNLYNSGVNNIVNNYSNVKSKELGTRDKKIKEEHAQIQRLMSEVEYLKTSKNK